MLPPPSKVKTVTALKYLTKSAPKYLVYCKDSLRMQTVAQQTKSFLSDRPVYHTSNKTAVNKELRFRDIEYRTRSYKLIEPHPFLNHKPNVTNL